jgi:hypothetical protein
LVFSQNTTAHNNFKSDWCRQGEPPPNHQVIPLDSGMQVIAYHRNRRRSMPLKRRHPPSYNCQQLKEIPSSMYSMYHVNFSVQNIRRTIVRSLEDSSIHHIISLLPNDPRNLFSKLFLVFKHSFQKRRINLEIGFQLYMPTRKPLCHIMATNWRRQTPYWIPSRIHLSPKQAKTNQYGLNYTE